MSYPVRSPRDVRALYLQHKDAIYRFVWRLTGSAAVAEDVLHDCFVSLLRNPDAYDPSKAPVKTFLFAIARNLTRKHFRAEHRWTSLEDDSFVAEPVDPIQGQTADLVAKAVQALPPFQREAILLFEFESLSIQEIALAVDAEPGTVKARLHRARENLRRILAPLQPNPPTRTERQWNP